VRGGEGVTRRRFSYLLAPEEGSPLAQAKAAEGLGLVPPRAAPASALSPAFDQPVFMAELLRV